MCLRGTRPLSTRTALESCRRPHCFTQLPFPSAPTTSNTSLSIKYWNTCSFSHWKLPAINFESCLIYSWHTIKFCFICPFRHQTTARHGTPDICFSFLSLVKTPQTKRSSNTKSGHGTTEINIFFVTLFVILFSILCSFSVFTTQTKPVVSDTSTHKPPQKRKCCHLQK